ncbi:protein spaetzle 4 isoform X3 [Armigeres subalbatus]
MNQQKKAELGLFHPLVLVTLIPILTTNGLGYDSASSCDTNASRKGRSAQLLQTIPCDLSIQAYCNLPGTSYPWHAVRRFVHENQGLMRRMYGDIRHISILKAEIDSNEIYLDDIHRAAEKYSRINAGKKVKHLYPSYHENNRDKVSDVITEPHFRPTQKTTTTATTTTKSTTTIKTTTSKPTTTSPAGDNVTSSESSSKVTFLNITLNNVNKDMAESHVKHSKIKMNTINGSSIDIEKLSSIAILETNETWLGNTSNTNSEKKDDKISNLKPQIESSKAQQDESTQSYSTSLPSTAEEKNTIHVTDSPKDNIIDTVNENRNLTKDSVKHTRPMGGQLFQDVAQKEQPSTGLKGVNACPVKEEVVAPFWANNTRGEVLALLNLYPFEQYVHWEKCAYELKQMYCREGCRCEQQYRLHRLLAYDPHNECRGIFSDWFRFPSCCICKCYDIPFDFRVTSRSPRTIVKESIQIAEDELQNAIYDHAVDEWYRPKNKEIY